MWLDDIRKQQPGIDDRVKQAAEELFRDLSKLSNRLSLEEKFEQAARKSYEFGDNIIKSISGYSYKRPECKSGCSYCCSIPVTVNLAEIMLIAKRIKQLYSDENLQGFIKNIEITVLKNKKEQSKHGGRIECILLKDNKCQVYDIRPCACRGYQSQDKSVCMDAFKSGPKSIQYVPALYLPYVFSAFGVELWLKSLGISNIFQELNKGILLALKNPAFWKNGQ
jgi:Fe-S-cluster containining protein